MCEMDTSYTKSHTSVHPLELTTDRGLLLPAHLVRGVGNRSQQLHLHVSMDVQLTYPPLQRLAFKRHASAELPTWSDVAHVRSSPLAS